MVIFDCSICNASGLYILPGACKTFDIDTNIDVPEVMFICVLMASEINCDGHLPAK